MIAGHYTAEQRGQVPFPYRRLDAMNARERAFVERVTAIVARRET